MINVAVMGYGTVGSGVVEVLRTNGELINERAQDVINVKYVLDLRDFPGDPVEEILTHDFETIVNDAEVDIVVETMGGVEPAYTFVKMLQQLLLVAQGTGTNVNAAAQQQAADQIKFGIIIVSTLPLLVLYPFLQKYFNKGVMLGAVKG